MKKNYMAPSMEIASYASQGLMQNPQIGFASGSGGTQTFNTAEEID